MTKALSKTQLDTLRRERLQARNKLARAMELAEVTQVELAEALGITQPHVSAITLGRYGEKGLPTETSRELAQYFGCAIEDLFPSREKSAVA